jgi:hypothetical protein
MSTKKSNPTPQRAKKKSPPTREETVRESIRAKLPTQAALAGLAARLATRYPMGSAIGFETAKALAEEAFGIWKSCEWLLSEVYSAQCEVWDEMQMEGPEFVDDYEAWDIMHAAVPPATGNRPGDCELLFTIAREDCYGAFSANRYPTPRTVSR